MEAVFVYGAKYQFVLTTGGPVLKDMGVEELSSLVAGLWFLHCKGVSSRSEPCDYTALRKPVTTLNIYAFLQLMEAPLVTEATVEPSQVRTVHGHLHTPLLFLFTQRETLTLDRSTAHSLAQRLRGQVGLVLIHRDSPQAIIPVEYNAAYRLPGEGSPVKFLTLQNMDDVVNLFVEKTPSDEEEEAEDEEDQEPHWSLLDNPDDEVAESVYRERGVELNYELVPELTTETIKPAVMETEHTVVLFYFRWDAASMAFMQSYLEIADMLKDLPDVKLARVDCGEWTDLCTSQNISRFPTIKMFRPGEEPQLYRGMLGTESLHRFIMLSRVPVPLLLSSWEEVQSYLGGELYRRHARYSAVTVLGLFSSSMDQGSAVFRQAAKRLRGQVVTGLVAEELATKWAQNFAVKLPAMLVSRGAGFPVEAFTLQISAEEEMTSKIQRAMLDKFPELTVENLPSYLELGKPLLLLFVQDENGESGEAIQELRGLLGRGLPDSYLLCWIHLSRTPAGRGVLESYLGSVPVLPALVLVELGSGEEVFQFPPGRPLLTESVLQWLVRLKNKEEQPAGVISDGKWGPPVPFYDFLAIMDKEAPGFAAQRSPQSKKDVGEEEEDEEERDQAWDCKSDKPAFENPSPSPAQSGEPPSPQHWEL
ncbi:TXD16 protein, partial [Amia calva]|nr:TXD16 protein [Amia calva]